MKEIITLQFGHYSNYVGTHYWNIQASNSENSSFMGNDILFQNGINGLSNEMTYTPRCLIFDLKNSLGSLRKTGYAYCDNSSSSSALKGWKGPISVINQEDQDRKKNDLQEYIDEYETESTSLYSQEKENKDKEKEFEDKFKEKAKKVNIDDDVELWSDFLQVDFHPKTIIEVENHKYDIDAFDTYVEGLETFKMQEDEILDKFHHFAEESDCLQGFQCFVELDNGFGGIASKVIEYLNEEFPTKPILCGCFQDQKEKQQQQQKTVSRRNLNRILAANSISPLVSWMMPLDSLSISDFDDRYQRHNLYHSSSLLATYLDCFSSPYRLSSSSNNNNNNVSMDYMFNDFSGDCNIKSNYLSASLSLPFSMGNFTLESSDLYDISGLMSQKKKMPKPFSQILTLRSNRITSKIDSFIESMENSYLIPHDLRLPIAFPKFIETDSVDVLSLTQYSPKIGYVLKKWIDDFSNVNQNLHSEYEFGQCLPETFDIANEFNTIVDDLLSFT